jgi:hypothetical protein
MKLWLKELGAITEMVGDAVTRCGRGRRVGWELVWCNHRDGALVTQRRGAGVGGGYGGSSADLADHGRLAAVPELGRQVAEEIPRVNPACFVQELLKRPKNLRAVPIGRYGSGKGEHTVARVRTRGQG